MNHDFMEIVIDERKMTTNDGWFIDLESRYPMLKRTSGPNRVGSESEIKFTYAIPTQDLEYVRDGVPNLLKDGIKVAKIVSPKGVYDLIAISKFRKL